MRSEPTLSDSSRQAAIANDHFVFTGIEADDKQTRIGRQFAELHGIRKPYYATPGDGIFHFYFPEQGLVMPGQFIPGADSHSRAYGAYGAVGIGVVALVGMIGVPSFSRATSALKSAMTVFWSSIASRASVNVRTLDGSQTIWVPIFVFFK